MRHIHDMNVLGPQLNHLQLGPPPTLSPSSSAPYGGIFPYPNPYPTYPPFYGAPWSQSTYGEQPTTGPITNGGYSAGGHNYRFPEDESPSVSISASTDSSALSRLDTPGDGGPVGALGLTGIGKPEESGVTESPVINVNSPHDYDDFNVVTENPQYSEHAHNQHQSQVRVMDAEPHAMTSGYKYNVHGGCYPVSLTPSWDVGGVHYYSQVAGLSSGDQKFSVTRSSSCASLRSKSATRKYKTKPCRYFSVENGCPNGDSCTFLHDASIPPVPLMARSHSKSPTSSGNGDDDTTFFPRRTDQDGENAENDTSRAEDAGPGDNKEKKNFFPITWRVIGGGVLMGGKRPEISGGDSLRESRGDGGGDVATEKKGHLKFDVAAPRPRSSSVSTPIARPNTVIGVRRYNDRLFSAELP